MAYRLKGRCGYDKDDPFKPTFHQNRLLEPLEVKKPSKIFTVSMGEFFDPKVPDLWRDLVFRVILEAEQHTFLILTKQSIPYELEYEVPSNVWFGVSLDGKTTDSDWAVEDLLNSYAPHRFVSVEPLLGPVSFDMELVDWIIIGAQTGAGAKQPRWEWVQDIIAEAILENKPVFIKDNLDFPEGIPRPQEWPKELE
jgi:protein gp37